MNHFGGASFLRTNSVNGDVPVVLFDHNVGKLFPLVSYLISAPMGVIAQKTAISSFQESPSSSAVIGSFPSSGRVLSRRISNFHYRF